MSAEEPHAGRKPGCLYVILDCSRMDSGEAPDELFVEVEDHLGRSVGAEAVPGWNEGPLRLLEFRPACGACAEREGEELEA